MREIIPDHQMAYREWLQTDDVITFCIGGVRIQQNDYSPGIPTSVINDQDVSSVIHYEFAMKDIAFLLFGDGRSFSALTGSQ